MSNADAGAPQRSSSGDDFDDCIVAWRALDARVSGHQWGGKRLSEGDVGRVERRDVRAELPDAGEQRSVGIPLDTQVREVVERLLDAFRVDSARELEASQCTQDLDVDDVRGMEGLPRSEKTRFEPVVGADPEMQVDES